MLKFHKTMVKVWLVIAILAALFAGWQLIAKGWDEAKFLLILPLIAGIWYGTRRAMVGRIEKILIAEEKRKEEREQEQEG